MFIDLSLLCIARHVRARARTFSLMYTLFRVYRIYGAGALLLFSISFSPSLFLSLICQVKYQWERRRKVGCHRYFGNPGRRKFQNLSRVSWSLRISSWWDEMRNIVSRLLPRNEEHRCAGRCSLSSISRHIIPLSAYDRFASSSLVTYSEDVGEHLFAGAGMGFPSYGNNISLLGARSR